MRLELRGITKRYGPVTANDHVDLVVEPGQIHCLLGENGAGKSTLMNVLVGLVDADEGEVVVDGVSRTFTGPGDAVAAGIGMVHQHFMLVPVLTVAENVMLGHEPTRSGVAGALGLLDRAAARAAVERLDARFGLHVDPDALVEDLPVGVQQRVEILKALSRDARVLILDEPTAVLTPQETDELIGIMRELRDAGTAIVFITHKLREVHAVADRITVLRRGAVVGTALPTASETELAALMVGRPVRLVVAEEAPARGPVALAVGDLTVVDDAGRVVVDGVTLDVHDGEIVALAGVQGNGQTELVEALVGLRPATAGSVTLRGVELLGRPVRDVIRAAVGYVPEDRAHDGLIGSFTVAENLVLNRYDEPPFATGPALRPAAVQDNARRLVDEFDVRTEHVQAPASSLSGGNQQKLVLAREMSRPLALLVAAQPTRGVDVGSVEFLHARLVRERDEGTPVLVVSTDLDEIAALADRVAVMYRGRVIGVVPRGTPRDVLGLMMAGVPHDQAVRAAAEQASTSGGDAAAGKPPADEAEP